MINLAEITKRLQAGDLSVAPQLINLLETETAAGRQGKAELLRFCAPETTGNELKGQIVGITGPPGVGKSSLVNELIAYWRHQQQTVALLAVDPSSQLSGGSLLGDRARVQFDPSDHAIFIRSMAAAEKLGGLAPATQAAAHTLISLFDIVIVETVGVGQSETDISNTADTVLVTVQPGSGDTLQFLKAGIMEVPDILVVTKADLGILALTTQRDLHAALRSVGSNNIPIIPTSIAATPPTGIEPLAAAIQTHFQQLDLRQQRQKVRQSWALAEFVSEYGRQGIQRLGGKRSASKLLEQAPYGTSVTGYIELLINHHI